MKTSKECICGKPATVCGTAKVKKHGVAIVNYCGQELCKFALIGQALIVESKECQNENK